MASEDDGFVFYGTPLEREEDLTRKRKREATDRGTLRIASSSQEVVDENGRRRFHGAFTGGFSAGYYNTVGSKEGWTPQTFTSSRNKRADWTKQKAYDFMDDEEKAEQDSSRLTTSVDFDTFGFTAAEFARKEAAEELNKRPSAIPGFIPDEIIVPVSQSMGIELLRKMGWRHGRGIGPKHIAASSDAQREGRKALLAFAIHDRDGSMKEEDAELLHEPDDKTDNDIPQVAEIMSKNTLGHVINPKTDRHGFGYDPYKNAPEFRERHVRETPDARKAQTKQQNVISKPSLFRPNVGRMGSGFGIGALEELDEDDEDIYAPGIEITTVPSDEEQYAPTSRQKQQPLSAETKQKVIPGFRPALISGFKVEVFPPPAVPLEFDGVHKFANSLDSEKVHLSSEPDEVPPPDDMQLCKLIDGLATFVAKSGQKLESFYMEKRNTDPMFEFLFKGTGHAYYKWRLWVEHKKIGKAFVEKNEKASSLDSSQRGEMLGEVPLRRSLALPPEDHSRLQSALASAFTKSSSSHTEAFLQTYQPFSGDPAKQARFEQFLKDKYKGGLRSVQTLDRKTWTERERAQETIEFEAACENLQKKESNQNIDNASSVISLERLQAMINDRFAPQKFVESTQPKEDSAPSKYPRRNEQPWRPLPLLCKRFNLPDPFAGKPPPVPKLRSRAEEIILLANPAASILKPSNLENTEMPGSQPTNSISHFDKENVDHEGQIRSIVEKPIDLYKAIFSDDSDEDDVEFPQKPTTEEISAEAAQKALNRLEAGDFLASIGKELGLKVPPSDSIQAKKVTELPALPQVSEKKPQARTMNNISSEASGLEQRRGVYDSLSKDICVKTDLEKNKEIKPQESHWVNKKEQESPLRWRSQSNEEGSLSDSSSEGSDHGSRRKRKKDRKHSRRHRDHSRDSHKIRKRSRDEEGHSHKHHKHSRHKSRK